MFAETGLKGTELSPTINAPRLSQTNTWNLKTAVSPGLNPQRHAQRHVHATIGLSSSRLETNVVRISLAASTMDLELDLPTMGLIGPFRGFNPKVPRPRFNTTLLPSHLSAAPRSAPYIGRMLQYD